MADPIRLGDVKVSGSGTSTTGGAKIGPLKALYIAGMVDSMFKKTRRKK